MYSSPGELSYYLRLFMAYGAIAAALCTSGSDSQGGKTALIGAAYWGRGVDCVRLLLDAGANTEAQANVRLLSSQIYVYLPAWNEITLFIKYRSSFSDFSFPGFAFLSQHFPTFQSNLICNAPSIDVIYYFRIIFSPTSDLCHSINAILALIGISDS